MKQPIPIDALVTAFYEIDLAKAANALVYSRGDPITFRCHVCGILSKSHSNPLINGGPQLGSACLDCTCGDAFR